MTSLLAVIRHGPTEWNELGKIQGRTDIPLSERGKSLIQQLQLPDFFSEMDWITSPLSRAIETGKLLGITEMLIDDRLIETNWGDWEGQVLQDLRVKYGQKMLENEKSSRSFKENCPDEKTKRKSSVSSVSLKGSAHSSSR